MLACSCSHTAHAAGNFPALNVPETSGGTHLQRIEVAGCIALPLLLPPHAVKQQAGHACAIKTAAAALLLLLGICVHSVCPLRRLLRARCLAPSSAILLPSLLASAAAGDAWASILPSPFFLCILFFLKLAPAWRQHCRQGGEAGAACHCSHCLLHHLHRPTKARRSMQLALHSAPLRRCRQACSTHLTAGLQPPPGCPAVHRAMQSTPSSKHCQRAGGPTSRQTVCKASDSGSAACTCQYQCRIPRHTASRASAQTRLVEEFGRQVQQAPVRAVVAHKHGGAGHTPLRATK